MEQRHCKNCGSPLQHSYNHQCPYCHTLYDFNEPQEQVVEVKPEDLVDVKLRSNELVCGLLLRYKEENIQNVVTKEQFESTKYEVK